MAIVYFVRDGSGDGRTNQGQEVALSQIITAFPDCAPKWTQQPPYFNKNSPVNPVSEYRFVVVEVKKEECSGKFTKDGYWTLEGVSPADFSLFEAK